MGAWGAQDSSTDLRGPSVGGPVSGSLLFDLFVWIWQKPIVPSDLYRSIRDTLLVGLTGYSKQGQPVYAFGVGLSTFDKVNCYVQSHIQMNEYRDCVVLPAASKKFGRQINTCLKVMDMTGLKLSALSQIKIQGSGGAVGSPRSGVPARAREISRGGSPAGQQPWLACRHLEQPLGQGDASPCHSVRIGDLIQMDLPAILKSICKANACISCWRDIFLVELLQ